MRRREFITLLGRGSVAWPLAARAQHADRIRQIGMLMAFAEGDPEGQAFIAAFREGLQKLGWIGGHNIRLNIRWARLGDPELRQRFAKEINGLNPDLIISHGTPNTAALVKQTRDIPIIFVNVTDPIRGGFVASFPRLT